MTDASEWQGRTGDSWAAHWRRTDRTFTALTDRLLTRSREFSFRSVLDVGCGAGELSLALARLNPLVDVTGVDISPQLVEAARDRGANQAHVRFELADAAAWDGGDMVVPDLLVSRHGVMFFEDPPAAFANLARLSSPGAGLLFSCFRPMADNPVFSEVTRLLSNLPEPNAPGAPGPFAFAHCDHVERILTAGGWSGIDFEPFDFGMIVGVGEDAVEETVQYFGFIGPAAKAAREMGPEERERFFDRVRELARRNLRDGFVAMRAAVWIVTGHKA